jgi:hypothetical protein
VFENRLKEYQTNGASYYEDQSANERANCKEENDKAGNLGGGLKIC